jgi:kinesin family protein C1
MSSEPSRRELRLLRRKEKQQHEQREHQQEQQHEQQQQQVLPQPSLAVVSPPGAAGEEAKGTRAVSAVGKKRRNTRIRFSTTDSTAHTTTMPDEVGGDAVVVTITKPKDQRQHQRKFLSELEQEEEESLSGSHLAKLAASIAEINEGQKEMKTMMENGRLREDMAGLQIERLKGALLEASEELFDAAWDFTEITRLEKNAGASSVERELRSNLEKEKSKLERVVQRLEENQEAAGKRTQEMVRGMERENQQLKAKWKKSQAQADTFSEQATTLKLEKKDMFNTIQELRGNVRVFARVRPHLTEDNSDDDVSVVKPLDEFTLVVSENAGNDKEFSFDKVFSESAGQEEVFAEVSDFVQSALDGYDVCLFSYGQTGSGKTHTMQGSGRGDMRGIIPRAIQQVGNYKNDLEKDGWEYHVQVSFLEIYSDTIRDLLREESGEMRKHDVKFDKNGRHYVTGITMQDLDPNDSTSVEDVMRRAAKHRSVASTDMNANSSRSHSVFTLYLKMASSDKVVGEYLENTLNLCDLAGSERVQKSGAEGERMKEAISINKSLSCLRDVFTAIGNKAGHVPYRNSKLTRLLEPCLSGNGKALMFVNLSPTAESRSETVCSLRFAAAVNKCELGKAKKGVESVVGRDEAKGGKVGGTSSRGRQAEGVESVVGGRSRSTPSKLGGWRK